MDFKKIWKARDGEADESFVEVRRRRFADAFLGQVERIKTEREAAADKRGFDHRLKTLGGALAMLDGKRSAKLILELMEIPGRFDGWTRVGALESLLVWGVRLNLDEVQRILDPVMQEARDSGLHSDNQNAWLFARCLSVMAFVDPPEAGIAKIRTLISELRFRQYELGGVVAAIGASRCAEAIDVLMEFAGADGKGVDSVGESWIEAIGMLEGARSNEILLSFVDPNANLFTREFIPDHRHGDLLARILADRTGKDEALKSKLVEFANGDLTATKRMLLGKVFGQFTSEHDRVQGLCVLRDDSGIPYELVQSMETAFLEHRPYGNSGNSYTLHPLGCNGVRQRLFEMVLGDPHRKKSAFALLGQIGVWRLEHGHPADEPRHPAIESDVFWPPLLS
jgi:NACHT C-terminal Alpha/Beta 2